jgi:hypothetical protein
MPAAAPAGYGPGILSSRCQAGALGRALYNCGLTSASIPYIRPLGAECRAAFSTASIQSLICGRGMWTGSEIRGDKANLGNICHVSLPRSAIALDLHLPVGTY